MGSISKVNEVDNDVPDIPGNGVLLASGDLSAAASWDSGAFAVYDKIIMQFSLLGSQTSVVRMTLNNLSNATYYYTTLANGSTTMASAQTSILLFHSTGAVYPCLGTLQFHGKRIGAETSCAVASDIEGSSFSANGSVLLGATQLTDFPAGGLTSIQIAIDAGTLTGTVRIYGVNYP